MKYEVIYYTGGSLIGRWHRTNVRGIDFTSPHMIAKREELERMGYATMVKKIVELDRLGVPMGRTHQEYLDGTWKGEECGRVDNPNHPDWPAAE